MWVGARWYRGAWGKMIGRSCWREYSCSRLLREAPDRPQPAGEERECEVVEQLATHDTKTAFQGMNLTYYAYRKKRDVL